ncbi:hypothetical protein ACFL0Q_02950 [Thermodesulfobacteriota bacterium]
MRRRRTMSLESFRMNEMILKAMIRIMLNVPVDVRTECTHDSSYGKKCDRIYMRLINLENDLLALLTEQDLHYVIHGDYNLVRIPDNFMRAFEEFLREQVNQVNRDISVNE